jgi:predicted pyridoxine 5'-phosphate oxidase superfamily flavin-nucleotide-binding protein
MPAGLRAQSACMFDVLPDTDRRTSPWHDGEKTLQRSVGVETQMEETGRRVLRDYLTDQHRGFFPLLHFLVAGTVDRGGNAWATLIPGRPGFLQSPDPHTLHISAHPDSSDPATEGLKDGQPVGLLGIDLHTRRRNRLNGTVRRFDQDGFDVDVQSSFGNCPRYIQLRSASAVELTHEPRVEVITTLDDAARSVIRGADTFFVASYIDRNDCGRQVDVSHRGGKPGFVRVDDDGTLTIPDFAGNRHFATLGNILANPRAGLVFVDFETGTLLQMSGTASVVLEEPEVSLFRNAERLWRFKPETIVRRTGALPLRWAFEANGWSPALAETGDWSDVSH